MSECYCNICNRDIKDKKAMIAHYKAEHPGNAGNLYDQIGTTGDKFADGAVAELRHKRAVWMQRERLEADYKALVDRYNVIARTLNIVGEAVALAQDQTVKREGGVRG